MPLPLLTDESPDFSLVLGGPIFQMFRRSHLSGDGLELLHRRIVVIALVAWLPLLLLSMLGGHFLAGTVKLPFLHDIEAHVRLLVALPVLIAAELIVHSRIRPVVKAFLARRIVLQADVPRFLAAIDSATRLRNSVSVELGLLVFVFTVGQWLWRSQIALGTSTWYAIPQGDHLQLTAAGYWYAFVSVPIFQFILLRWYLRFFIWFRFLWQVSRLNLHLIPTHPDRAGGLAFLGKSAYAFSPILFAQGAVLAGVIASRVLYGGESLVSFKMEAVSLIGFFLAFVLGPLTMFTPQMARAKRKGLAEYGLLATRYVDGFEQKWVVGNAAEGDELLGTGDIQSLADLGNSYAAVKEMRAVPFGLEDIGRLAAATAAPLLPLGLTVFSLEELVMRIVKILF
ncbi:MAG: hypothetical protein ABSC64_02560 [Candidatus Korobacteraceae bacterium]